GVSVPRHLRHNGVRWRIVVSEVGPEGKTVKFGKIVRVFVTRKDCRRSAGLDPIRCGVLIEARPRIVGWAAN
ncbi:MAG: hypothetical protein AAFU85_03655, partial [Planctomycetota bacterium]